MSILDNVPSAFREPILGNADAIISAVVPQYADGASVNDVLHFISGAIRHQHRISINKDGHPLDADKSNSFKAVVERVEVFDRRGDANFLVGRKAKIHLKAKNANGDLEDQSIDTEWIEYYGGRAADEIFGIALANTIKEIAEDNIGKEVIVSKGFITGVSTTKGGNSVRFCSNIQPFVTAGDDTSSRGSSSSSSGSSSSSNAPLASREEIADFVLDIKKDKEAKLLFDDLNDEQQKQIPGIVLKGLAAGNPAAYINKTLENLDIKVNRNELDKIVAEKGEDRDFDLFFLIAEAATE